MGRLHAIISMDSPRLGEGKRAVLLVMGQVNLLKLVIAVEADVDPEDWSAVEWSLAARRPRQRGSDRPAGGEGRPLRSPA
jgi:UbiD family decarboxylase